MTATVRTLASVAAASLISLVLVSGALAAEPTPTPGTLGATVSGFVVMDESPIVLVRNEGSVATTFTAEVPDGWAYEPAALVLAPSENGRFTLTAVGDAGLMVINGTATDLAMGGDASSIQFGSIQLMQSRPFDPMRYAPGVLTGLLVLAGFGLVLYRTKPWRFRLVRAA